MCEHDRERSQCKECLGSSIYPHKRIKSKCKDAKAINNEIYETTGDIKLPDSSQYGSDTAVQVEFSDSEQADKWWFISR